MFVNYAHRGASHYYPENTLSSFYAGLRMGANGVETDIHRTKDDVLVLFHDDTLERVTDGSGNISDYTYEELLKLRVFSPDRGRVDRILSLEDFCKYFSFRNISFAIELKQDGVEKDTIDMLEKYGMREKVVLTSFNYESLKNARAYHPGYRLGYLYGKDEQKALEKMQAIGGEELCPEAELLTPAMVKEYHEKGFNVRAWGVYNPEIMRNAYLCGADGMTVNFPDLLTEFLAQKP